jgi:uncharacterized protein (TIGR02186 family)
MNKRLFLIVFLISSMFSFQAFAEGSAKLEVGSSNIDIGTFYNGTALKVTGTVPDDSEAVLRFIGKPSELHMKEKGKAMGLLWMNLNSLVFRDVPDVFLVSSSSSFSVSPDREAVMNTIGLSSLRKAIGVEAEKTDKTLAVNELIRLKQQEGLYRETSGNVSYIPGTGGQKNFAADIAIPSRLVPGEYSVELSVVRNGQVVASEIQPVSASFSGFPKLMSGIAFGNSLLYGVLATVIAIFSGFAIGMVFQSKGAH